MYSDKENINILTSLLLAHGIRHAVVCPGSRNAPFTHNLCEALGSGCESVTDERSAAFVALGKAQALDEPVAVCVTSGSALLNTLPAVAEAWYQHVPLVVISADRPAAMIGQLQGQTLPQQPTLTTFWAKEVSLPEPHDEVERWYCNRLVNEALCAMNQCDKRPVHINVPVSEPLFNFTTPELPCERVIRLTNMSLWPATLTRAFCQSVRPMLVIGQLSFSVARRVVDGLDKLRGKIVVLQEQLSNAQGAPCHFDEALKEIAGQETYEPDFVIYLGQTLVSKRAKHFLQRCRLRRCVVVNASGELTDVTMHATDVVVGRTEEVIDSLCHAIKKEDVFSVGEPRAFYERWATVLDKQTACCRQFSPAYSQMMAVRRLCKVVNNQSCSLQFANSTAIRLGQLYAGHYLFVNRGVNGIEGSLSTAVGFASSVCRPVYCVIGDLSFFYDQNALWNGVDKRQLHILLLNNSCGGIFHQLAGLEKSPYRDDYVSAGHHASAKGICEATGVAYRLVKDARTLADGISWLTHDLAVGPMLLEVFTDAEADARELQRYLQQ